MINMFQLMTIFTGLYIDINCFYVNTKLLRIVYEISGFHGGDDSCCVVLGYGRV
jgi:hypothetical protein